MRILLVDDHPMWRDGLRRLLEREPNVEVVAEAGDGRSALQQAHDTRPDIVVMDVGMAGLNGVEATRRICEELPETRVLALSQHRDRQTVASMLQAGAAGYLTKFAAPEEIVRALTAVADDRVYISESLLPMVVEDYVSLLSKGAPRPADMEMTQREREILQLVAEGHSTRSIARRLSISHKTVETHRRNIMRKAGVDTVAGLTKVAIREGLTSLEPR